jgi:hypothetical protein
MGRSDSHQVRDCHFFFCANLIILLIDKIVISAKINMKDAIFNDTGIRQDIKKF